MSGKATSRGRVASEAAQAIEERRFEAAFSILSGSSNGAKREAVRRALFAATTLDDEALDDLQQHLVSIGFSVRAKELAG